MRQYNKNEGWSYLLKTMKFPAVAYTKYNGFLGLVSYHRKVGKLFVASKSTNEGPFAEMLYSMVNDLPQDTLMDYVQSHNSTLVFEVIHQKEDPHIIEYPFKKGLILLDIIENTWESKRVPYTEVVKIAKLLGVQVKQQAYVLDDITGLQNLFSMINDYNYTYEGTRVEGFVVEDSNGIMVKMKCEYYWQWRSLRHLLDSILRNKQIDMKKVSGELANYFYAWAKNNATNRSIISGRRKFFNAYPQLKERYE